MCRERLLWKAILRFPGGTRTVEEPRTASRERKLGGDMPRFTLVQTNLPDNMNTIAGGEHE